MGKKKKAKVGHPPLVPIDQQVFEALCGQQNTLVDIADHFDCSEDTIERWCKRTYKKTFAEVFRLKRCRGRKSLRSTMFKLAQSNAAVAIFMSKNLLGWSDMGPTNDDDLAEFETDFTKYEKNSA